MEMELIRMSPGSQYLPLGGAAQAPPGSLSTGGVVGGAVTGPVAPATVAVQASPLLAGAMSTGVVVGAACRLLRPNERR